MGWFSEQIKKRKENNQQMFEDSFNDLAGIRDNVKGDEKDLRDNFICSQIINAYHFNELFEKFWRCNFKCCYS